MVMIDHIDHIKGSLTKRTNMGKMLNERSLKKWELGIQDHESSSPARLSSCLVALLFKSVVGLERN